jgi:SAM-dependent methyltransferase
MVIVDPESIKQQPCYEKLYRIPAVYYSDWLKRFGGEFNAKRVLDFGCGEGLSTLGLSLFCDAEKVVGVDIGTDFARLPKELQSSSLDIDLPGNIEFRRISPCEDLGDAVFDVIVSWSVLEHVAQNIFDKQMAVLVKALKPGGYCLFQVAPLYYAPFGSHLFGLHAPWEHLLQQTDLLKDRVYDQCPKDVADGFWNCFVTLNRFTAEEFVHRLGQLHLEILNVYETYVADTPSENLLRIFNNDVLTKEQILVVCKKMS